MALNHRSRPRQLLYLLLVAFVLLALLPWLHGEAPH